MVARKESGGVPLVELRAGIAAGRATGGDGVVWPMAVWERVWASITPRQQHVVYLHTVLGQSQTAVAEQLGLSRGSVDGTWRRAIARIRDALPSDN